MTDLELRNGWLVPAAVAAHHMDFWTAEAVEHIDLVLPFLQGREMCVQAGGNMGIWPALLVGRYGFKHVVTYEPDATNWKCLTHNVRGLMNVRPINTALGSKPGWAKWSRASEHKPGWHKIAPTDAKPKSVAGEVEVSTIDALALDSCDFIALDIEGYELPALQGAEQTIERCRPVVLFEDLGRSADPKFRAKGPPSHGLPAGGTQKWLGERGYSMVASVKNDEVWAPL